MSTALLIIALLSIAGLVGVLIINKRLEKRLSEHGAESERIRQNYEKELLQARAKLDEELQRGRQQYDSDVQALRAQAQGALAKAQELLDEQAAELEREAQRVRQHYEGKAREALLQAEAMVARTLKEVEPLRRFECIRDPEAEARRILAEALEHATSLRAEAESLVNNARLFAAEERTQATRKARELEQQATALLHQATVDAGRIVSDAEKRAEEVAGDAYVALRDKNTLEQAVQALWNVAQGYGDRYVVPTRSMLDDLAADFGHTEAGEALRVAREHSRRMVELKQASACNYVEIDRQERANRFVVDAFNGRVDAILTRVKHDNYGTLAQEIRDAFSLVNLNGIAFRDARILPAYLDARLLELKWAAVVQELKLQEREEQQRIREQMREEEKARREYERAIREAASEEEALRKAMEKAQAQIDLATAEQKAKYEQQLSDLSAKLKEAEARNQRAISMAQQTRRGHVYIISNIGSFGEHIYKIGLTRRLEPQERVDELGDSSVPFDFDIHALIYSEDAPALEAQLHRHFLLNQVNKVNHRKEFFRADLKHIREEIEKLGLSPKWTMTSAAAEYRETLAIERQIQTNPAMREAWIKRQLQLELVEHELNTPVSEDRLDRNREPVSEMPAVGK